MTEKVTTNSNAIQLRNCAHIATMLLQANSHIVWTNLYWPIKENSYIPPISMQPQITAKIH